MPDITITVSDEVAGRLAVLADPSAAGDPAAVIYELIDHAQQAVYRPGSWERDWACRVFGYDWPDRLEPDTRPEMLAGDGRVIFDRPKRSEEGERDG